MRGLRAPRWPPRLGQNPGPDLRLTLCGGALFSSDSFQDPVQGDRLVLGEPGIPEARSQHFEEAGRSKMAAGAPDQAEAAAWIWGCRRMD